MGSPSAFMRFAITSSRCRLLSPPARQRARLCL